MDGHVSRRICTHGVAYQRGFGYFKRFQKTRQKLRQQRIMIIGVGFIRVTETDLVKDDHAEIGGQRVDIQTPFVPTTPQTVQ